MSIELVHPCDQCGEEFVLSRHQWPAKARGCKVYCGKDCTEAARRQRTIEFYRSEAGKEYQRNRRRIRARNRNRKQEGRS